MLQEAEGIIRAAFEREGGVGRDFGALIALAPIFKVGGGAMSANITFGHLGPVANPTVIWSIAPGSSLPGVHQEDKTRHVQIAAGIVPVQADVALTTYSFITDGVWPAAVVLPAAGFGFSWERTDCRVEIFLGGVSLLMRWWDDIYSVIQAEYRDLEAVFT